MTPFINLLLLVPYCPFAFVFGDSIIPEKQADTGLQGVHLYVGYFIQPPWVEVCGGEYIKGNRSACRNGQLPGLDVDMFLFIHNLLGFDFTLIFANGMGQENVTTGEWTGMLGLLHRNEANMSINTPYITFSRQQAVNYMNPNGHSKLATMVRVRPSQIPPLTLVMPFGVDVWVSVFCLVPLVALSCWFLNVASILMGRTPVLRPLRLIIWDIFIGILLQDHGCSASKTSIHEMVIVSWQFTFVLLMTVYTTLIYSLLLFSAVPVDPYNSLESLIPVIQTGTMKPMITKGIYQFLLSRMRGGGSVMTKLQTALTHNQPILIENAERYLVNSLIERYYVQKSIDIAYIDIDIVLSMMLTKRDACGLKMIELPDLDGNYYAPAFSKRFEFRGIFDDYSQLIRSFYARLEDMYAVTALAKDCRVFISESSGRTFSLLDLWPIFALSVMLLGLASFCFMIERFFGKIKGKKVTSQPSKQPDCDHIEPIAMTLSHEHSVGTKSAKAMKDIERTDDLP